MAQHGMEHQEPFGLEVLRQQQRQKYERDRIFSQQVFFITSDKHFYMSTKKKGNCFVFYVTLTV